MLLLSKEMAILKPAHYIRDGLICQYGETGTEGRNQAQAEVKVKAGNDSFLFFVRPLTREF